MCAIFHMALKWKIEEDSENGKIEFFSHVKIVNFSQFIVVAWAQQKKVYFSYLKCFVKYS